MIFRNILYTQMPQRKFLVQLETMVILVSMMQQEQQEPQAQLYIL